MRYSVEACANLRLGRAVSAWAVLMLIVWALFTPRGLPVETFTMLTLTGSLVLVLAWGRTTGLAGVQR